MTRQLTAIIEREDNGYVALCPEVDVASQGATVDEARSNLKEALELFFETVSREEIQKRLQDQDRFHFPYTESELLADLTLETAHADELAKIAAYEFGD